MVLNFRTLGAEKKTVVVDKIDFEIQEEWQLMKKFLFFLCGNFRPMN